VRHRPPRWLTITLVALLLVSAAGFILVRSASFRIWLRKSAERSLSAFAPGAFQADALDIDVAGGLSLRGLRYSDSRGRQVFTARLVRLRWSWASLLLGRPLVREARISRWELEIEPFIASLRSSEAGRTRRTGIFAVERLVLENGRVVWTGIDGKPSAVSADVTASWGRTPARDEINLLGIETDGALQIRRGAGSVTITDDAVVLHKIRLWTAHGELEGSGSGSLPKGPLTGVLSLRDVDVATVGRLGGRRPHIQGSLSAQANVSGTMAEPQIEMVGAVEDAVLAGVPLGRVAVNISARGRTGQLDIPDVYAGGAHAGGRLTIGPNRTDLEVRFQDVDLREALSALDSELPTSRLTGALSFSDDRTAGTPRPGTFTLSLEGGRFGSVRFDEALASGYVKRGTVTVELCRAVSGSTTVEAAGKSDGHTVDARIRAEGAWGDLGAAWGRALRGGGFLCEADIRGRLSAPRVELVWSGDNLHVGPAVLAKTAGVASGAWPAGIDVRAAWSDEARIGHLRAREGRAKCRVGRNSLRSVTCDVDLGSGRRLSLAGEVGWPDEQVHVRLTRCSLEAGPTLIELTRPASWSLAQGRLQIGDPLELMMHGKPVLVVSGDSSSTRARVELDSLEALRAVLVPEILQEGSLSAEATVTGRLAAPSGHAELHARDLRLAEDGPLAAADLTMEMDSGTAVVRGRVAADDQLTASLEGRLTPRGREGTIWTADPSGWVLVEDASLPAVQRLIVEVGKVRLDKVFLTHSGRATFRAGAERGDWEGSLDIENAEVTVHEINTRFERVRGSAVVNRQGMRVVSLSGALGDDGEATMSGTIPWAEGGIGEFVLDVTGTSVELAPAENIWMKANPRITYRRDGRFLRLEGEVPIDEGLVEGVFWEGGATAPSRALWDLALWAPGRVWIRTDNADVETAIDLRLRRQGRDYAVEGTVEALRGKLHYLGRHFDITQGTLQFRGRTPPDPLVSVHSTTTIRPTSADGEEVIVNFGVQGSLLEPEVVLSSDPAGYTHEQLVAMLVLDLSPEEAQDMTTVLSQELAAAMQGVLTSELAKVVRKEAGLDALYLETPGPGQDPAEVQLLVGKYLTPDLYVSVGKELLSSSLDNVRVEYLLHRARAGKKRLDLRLTGERDKDQEYGQYRYNVDLKLRYRF
jgi:autotransporter translocation and assembly factor TamB